jgi:biotin carboxylase
MGEIEPLVEKPMLEPTVVIPGSGGGPSVGPITRASTPSARKARASPRTWPWTPPGTDNEYGERSETRIYAEDPTHNFLPATGKLVHLHFPDNGIRVDTGFREGDEITSHYDPLLAKIITVGEDRAAVTGAGRT